MKFPTMSSIVCNSTLFPLSDFLGCSKKTRRIKGKARCIFRGDLYRKKYAWRAADIGHDSSPNSKAVV